MKEKRRGDLLVTQNKKAALDAAGSDHYIIVFA
jgi:hypothetical protein